MLKNPRQDVENSYKQGSSTGASGAGCVGLEYTECGGGIVAQYLAHAGWARHQLAAAIWAAIMEVLRVAGTAEGALERADQRIRAFRWQVGVAAFAVGAQVEHVQGFHPVGKPSVRRRCPLGNRFTGRADRGGRGRRDTGRIRRRGRRPGHARRGSARCVGSPWRPRVR